MGRFSIEPFHSYLETCAQIQHDCILLVDSASMDM